MFYDYTVQTYTRGAGKWEKKTLPKEISKVPLTFRPRASRYFSKETWKQCSHMGV